MIHRCPRFFHGVCGCKKGRRSARPSTLFSFLRHNCRAYSRPRPLPSCNPDMGIIRSSFPFLLGIGCGVYIAQNYTVPNIKQLADDWLSWAKNIERAHRRGEKDGD